ncbi:serine/threonine-protein kinase [Paraliomyxa miuraensis]|uniref:serine/threonine-protein kinase n=1 Tax=Paraliomyxa miuraensis TaxID=376150 RepID=UPI00224DF098|nr:serine/threonine-protein kinase [Paraliomyxa miuraensis]MCX4243533.1 protein kinase [Paraliomyxa miuraensis]
MLQALKAGDRVDDRFELQERVASGGSGQIFRARDLHTGRMVAFKVVYDENETNLIRFGREAQLLATVSHPGVVRYVAHGQTPGGAHYLVMEWLEGEDLGSILTRRGSPTQDGVTGMTVRDPEGFHAAPTVVLTLPEVIGLGKQLASALAALHDLGVIHRDIKPTNVFAVGGSLDHIKLLDFGTARFGRTPTSLTRTGAIVGTPMYMAPEQVDGDRNLTPAVDVWATGVLLYECLTGETPFKARTVLAVLTKIAIDDPPDLAELRPDLPPALLELIMGSLSKDPSERPQDGHALRDTFEVLAAHASIAPVIRATGPLGASLGGPSVITRAEQRVHCILLAQRVRLWSDEITDLQRLAADSGAVLTHLPDESILVTARSSALPTDQATRVARAALALRARMPRLRISMALGRAAGGQANLVGDAIGRAVSSLRVATPGEIRLDPTVAEILDARFVVSRDGPHLRLEQERETETPRTLLGRKSTWVGRRREMVTLEEIFEECMDEPVARVVLVTGPAGAGKSRLRDEVTRSLRSRAELELLLGQGDSVTAGSPFVMIAPAIRRYAGIHTGEAVESSRRKLRARITEHVGGADLERVTQFLGELIGVPFPDTGHESLQAARKDPMLMGDAMQAAFVDWLRALCSAQPVVFVLDDLHWGDLPSVRYVDAALRALRDLPLMVLALARPEVSQRFPSLWTERALQEIRLDALSRSASRKLVRHMLGDDVDPELEALIVERAGGNAFYLEELIRAVATSGGHDGLPDSILGMLQARFDELGEEAKRVLRAASVFGEVFWAEGVEALLGRTHATFSAAEWLEELAQREIITPRREGRFPQRHEYKFRHALVRDAAHELLTEDDRLLGHRLAGLWLEQEGETDPSVLAEHFLQGDEPARARICIQRAAAQALEGNDLEAVIARAEQAIELGAEGDSRGQLRSMQSVAGYWQGDYARAQERGVDAVGALEAGSTEWFRALGTTIVASARRGDYDSVERWFQVARGQDAAPDAGRDQIVCLCRGCFQLIFAGRLARADELLADVTEQVQQQGGAASLDPLTLAQVEHVRGVRAAHGGDVGRFLVHLEAAVAAFERAGDRRNVSLERPTVGWCFAEIGMFERAEEILVEALALAEELGARQTITYAEVNLGYVLGHRGRLDDAVTMLERAAATCASVGNVRLEGWARTHISGIEQRRARYDRAEAEAATAIERLAMSPGLRAWATAERSRALLGLGRPEQALETAKEAMALLIELGSMLQGESSPPLALAEALLATRAPEAAAAVTDAKTRLQTRAARLPRPEWQPTFLARPENARILELPEAG